MKLTEDLPCDGCQRRGIALRDYDGSRLCPSCYNAYVLRKADEALESQPGFTERQKHFKTFITEQTKQEPK